MSVASDKAATAACLCRHNVDISKREWKATAEKPEGIISPVYYLVACESECETQVVSAVLGCVCIFYRNSCSAVK